MKQVTCGDLEVIEMLKAIIENSIESRKMKYCYSYKIDSGWLVLNGITQVLLFMDENEYNDFFETDFAKETFFSVPLDIDEMSVVKEIRKSINKSLYQERKAPTKYTIFTTTACNARCSYCFEKGIEFVSMNDEIAKQVSQYIVERCDGINEDINIHWFGGEPLLNSNIIDKICSDLEKANLQFHSTMTSNGLLIDQYSKEVLLNKWKLNQIQITLDGTREIYNATKKYVVHEDDAYEHVIQNIKMLLDLGIAVEIRLNISTTNGENLLKLIDELYQEIGNHDCLSVYCCSLLERDDNNVYRRTEEDNKLLEAYEIKIQKRMFELGFFKERLRPILWTRRCSAERESEITIMPDGSLGICALYYSENRIGHINNPEINRLIVDSFKEHFDDLEECFNCDLYPQCLRIKKCKFDTDWCPKENRDMARQEMFQQMQYEYQCFMKEYGE